MDRNVPFIWRKIYSNEGISPEKALEIAHEKARQLLSRAINADYVMPNTPKTSYCRMGDQSDKKQA